jgi:dynein heavy chain 2, cytosolic
VEAELGEVQPLVDAAAAAVGGLTGRALSEVRSMKAPPEAVRDVLEAVLRLMGQADTSWTAMKRFMSATGVKERILGFDAGSVTPATRAAVAAVLTQHAASFQPERIARVSLATAPLAEWVKVRRRTPACMRVPHPRAAARNAASMHCMHAGAAAVQRSAAAHPAALRRA